MEQTPHPLILLFQKYYEYVLRIPRKIYILNVSIFAGFFILYFLIISVPSQFPLGRVVTVSAGDSLQTITLSLKESGVIRSEIAFRSLVILLGRERGVIAGDYLMDERGNVITIARRLVSGKFHVDTVKITIPEGWNVFQIGDHLEKNLINFNKKEFITEAKKYEGYLFPDTYFIPQTYGVSDIILLLNTTYQKKINDVLSKEKFSRPIADIVIMASILEGEALPQDRKIVAGILWRRIAIGMPLQVDATFKYINGKNTYELTRADLKIDSPYNTYVYQGLPPGPISNPGIDAILSAGNPTATQYLYFLTEKDGTIHYAKTFAEHVKNKERYLR